MAKLLILFTRNMSTLSLKHKSPLSVFGVEGRYASALYSAANEMKQLDAVEKGVKSMLPLLSRPTVMDFVETSLMSRSEKGNLLKTIGVDAGLPESLQNFLQLVAENGRLKLLKGMIQKFLDVMVAHRNEALCEVITAEPLDAGDKAKLMTALKSLAKGKNITLTERIDSTIIGGMVVGIEDKHIDMSISKKVQMYGDLIKQAV